MADRIRKVSYFYTMAPNRAGVAAKILRTLRGAKVNLLAFTGFPHRGRAQLDFIPQNTAAFLRACRAMGVRPSRKKVGFLVQGSDRVGACSSVLDKLARVRINVTAVDALVAGGGRWGALLWVKPGDVAKAARALGAR